MQTETALRHETKSAERFSLFDAAFYSLMVGCGETYLVAFALALGVSERSSALLGVLPVALGSILQLGTGRGVALFRSMRRWVVFCASCQAIALCSFGLASQASGNLTFFILFASATMYWSAGQAAGPIWNAWIGHLVAPRRQQGFFFLRNAVQQGSTLIALLAAGTVLATNGDSSRLNLFLGLFGAAAGFRFVSAFFLSRHPEPISPRPQPPALSTLKPFLSRPYVVYAMAFSVLTNATVHVSASFFTPYMLQELDLGYSGYAGLLAAAFVARMATGWLLKSLVRRHGVQTMFLIGVFGIIPLPALWVVADHYLYLVILQVLSGIAWGCHEMGLTLYLLEHIDHGERSRLLSWTNLAASTGMIVGIFGGWSLAGSGNPSREVYALIFVVSTVLRALPLLLVRRFVRSIKGRPMTFRILGVRPAGQGILRPVLTRGEEKDDRP